MLFVASRCFSLRCGIIVSSVVKIFDISHCYYTVPWQRLLPSTKSAKQATVAKKRKNTKRYIIHWHAHLKYRPRFHLKALAFWMLNIYIFFSSAEYVGDLYIQGGPKMAPFLYALTLPNINWFSQLFHCQNQEKICNNTITKDLTTPPVCRYTTLWKCQVCVKSSNWKQDDGRS